MSDNKKVKTIELWDGYEVEFNEQLLDDFDFQSDLSSALKNNDIETVTTMYFAIIGGEDVYEKVKEKIIEDKGYFSINELSKITKKIEQLFPKAGNRAQKHSWQTSR